MSAPSERTDLSRPASEDRIAYGAADSEGAHEYEVREHDDWFRWVADPDEVAERERRIAEAEQGASDAFDAGDRVRMNAFVRERERAFWAMPAEEHTRPDAYHDVPAQHAATDDDADGWY